MMPNWIHELIAEKRMEELRAEAETDRLIQSTRSPHTFWRKRFALALGARLIAAGASLQKRYEPINYHSPESDCSTC